MSISRVLLSGTGTVLTVLALSPATSWATYPGANGRIAYSGGPETGTATDTDIYTVLADGSGVQLLTDNGVWEHEPSWSADGQRLTYVRKVRGSARQVFTMRADGSHQRRVTYEDRMIHSSPSFSPSGRRIVYVKDNLYADSDGPRRVSIFKIRPDGRKKRRLVTGYLGEPTYSPNGNRIVFHGKIKGRPDSALWTVRRDGSDLRRLTDAEADGWDADQALDWSPGGGRILFERCNASSRYVDCYLWLMWPDGSHKHPVRGIYGNAAVFAPSGRSLALSQTQSDDFGYGVCSDVLTTTLTGSDSQLLTHNCEDYNSGGFGGSAHYPSWQPIAQP